MASATYIVLSTALSFGAPLALAIRELFADRRPRGDGGRDEPPPEPPRRPGPRPLPDCLLPPPVVRAPTAIRVLEDA